MSCVVYVEAFSIVVKGEVVIFMAVCVYVCVRRGRGGFGDLNTEMQTPDVRGPRFFEFTLYGGACVV